MKKILIGIAILVAITFLFLLLWERKDNPSSSSNTPLAIQEADYAVKVLSNTSNLVPDSPQALTFQITSKDEVVKDFSIAHEKLLHLIVVREDLQYFQHLHPDFNNSTGTFSINISFPEPGPYKLYADFAPADNNPNKLSVTKPFDVIVGNQQQYRPVAVIPDNEITEILDTYIIDQYFEENLTAGENVYYNISVSLPDELVELEPYLGAMGHGVIINAETLEYFHTHAASMDMEGMEDMTAEEHMNHQPEPNSLEFHTIFPTPGKYKIFTQFQHKGKVSVIDYVVEVN